MASRSTLALSLAAACWLTLRPAGLGAQLDTARFHLDVASIMKGTENFGREPTGIQWTTDSRWVYFQWLPAGSDWRAPLANYRVRAAAGAVPERITREQLDSVAALFATGPTTHDGKWRVLSEQGDLWLLNVSSGERRRLTSTVQTEQAIGWSSDNGRIFYRVADAIFSLRLNDGFIEQLADIRSAPATGAAGGVVAAGAGGRGGRGAGTGRGGDQGAATGAQQSAQQAALARDQRELFQVLKDRQIADSLGGGGRGGRGGGGARGGGASGRGARGGGAAGASGIATYTLAANEQLRQLWVSPRGTEMLFTVGTNATTTPTEVPTWITTNGYVAEQPGRTNVGDAQGHQRLAVLSFTTGRITWLTPLPADTSGVYARLNSLGWNDDGSAAIVVAETGSYKTRVISRLDADSTRLIPIETQHDSAWIGGPCETCGGWLPENRGFWWVSEADGYAHIYTMRADGSARRQLTSGKWEVLRAQLSPDRSHFEITSNEGSPYEQHFYIMALDGTGRTRMTARPGGHQVTVSPDGTMLADVFSYTNEPPDLYLQPATALAPASRVTTSPSPAWRAFKWLDAEITEIAASDGQQVPARIYRPEQVGAKPNGAAILFVHGAGYLQNVMRIWSTSYPREYQFNQLLASRGYLVLELDYRGSAGYGRDWREAIYRHMGGRDLDDYVDASKWITAKYGIAPQHIGIYGGSYGGFMTLMALFTKAPYFGAGAALRPVSDWAHYNHGYTAEILNQPQDDSIAYHQSSPIFFADGLRAPLLIAHGMVDTNVEFEDSVMLIQRLIELGKTNWWIAPYPVEDHGFARPDSWTDEYRRILELFDQWLPRGAPGTVARVSDHGPTLNDGARLAGVGALINAVLAVIKGVAGVVGHSNALVADAVESAADVGGSLVVWGGLRLATQSADYDHPYGHGKAEPLSAAVVGLMLCGAAIGIVVKAVQEIVTPQQLPAPFTLAVLVVVVLVKTTLFRRALRVADHVGSDAVKADAWHHRADALTSGAAFVGISAALIGGPSWGWCDGAAAVAASLIVFFNGLHILRPAVHELMDGIPDASLLSRVGSAARAVDGVRMIEKLHARKVGMHYLVDLHVQADPALPLHDAHVLSGRVKTAIRGAVPSVQNVLVHMEPFEAGAAAVLPGS